MLPVAPSKLSIKINNQNKALTLINDGEVNILKKPGLTDIEFEALIPNEEYPFAFYLSGFKDAQFFLNHFEDLKNSLSPFLFRVVRDSETNTSISVSLEEYTIEEEAGNGKDYKVSFKLKQFKKYGTKVLNFNTATNTATAQKQRPVSRAGSTQKKQGQAYNYTIKSGDSLWKIAKAQLGNGKRQLELYFLNKKILDDAAKKNGKFNIPGKVHLYPGTVIVIKK